MFYRSQVVGVRSFMVGIIVVIAALAGVGVADAAAATLPSGFQDEVVFSQLKEPTNFKFAPDGRVFVALKSGRIMVYENLADTTPEEVVNLSEKVYDNQDHGLLGLAIDPNFPLKPYIYGLYTYDHVLGTSPADGTEGKVPRWGEGPTYEGDPCPDANGCLVSGRVVRLTLSGNHVVPGSEKVLVEGWCQQYSSHSIGDLGFGPEGALYASGGDGASFNDSDYGQFGNPCGDPPDKAGESLEPPSAEGGSLRAQSALSPTGHAALNGALLRVDPETGEGWPENPFADSADANKRRIVAFGFRNPFRFTVNARTQSVYVGNVGKETWEEIDQVPMDTDSAYNSGWPCYEGLAPEAQFKALELNACQRLYSAPGSVSSPLLYYNHGAPVAPEEPCTGANGSAIASGAFYEGSQWPAAYHDALVFADTVRGCLYVMMAPGGEGDPDPLKVAPLVSETTPYPGVDIESGPEGNIFYSSLFGPQGGTIQRVSYDPGAPQAQLAITGAGKEYGPTPLSLTFSAAGSKAAAGHSLVYEWDLDGNGTYEAATASATKSVTYAEARNVNAAVRVTDTTSAKTAIAHLTVYPGDSPPQVEIAEPAPSLTWGVGQTIHFAGRATVSGGGEIAESGLYWKTRLLHCPFSADDCHEHPLQVFPAKKQGTLVAPDHDFPSYINLELEATDGRGLTATGKVKIAARPVALQLVSNPPGIELTAATITAPAPFQLTAIESSPTTLVAPPTATIGGVTYEFQSWSDGGKRIHTVDADAPATYTATYSDGPAKSAPPASSSGPTPAPVTPPRPWFKLRPAARTRHRTARFVFMSEAAGYRCRLDDATFAPCRSPRVYRHLPFGPHVFRVYAVDADGQAVSPVSRYQWHIAAPAAASRNTAPRPR